MKNNDIEYLTRTSTIFTRLAEAMLSFKWLLLVLVSGITIFAFTQMQNLRFDNSNEVWFVEGDPTVELLDKFRDVFGNDDFVILLFESENFFEPDNIRLLGRLAEALEAEVPYLKDITWLGNVEYIESIPDGISVNELLGSIPQSPEAMAEVRKKSLSEDSYINSLISPDGSAYTIILEMERYPEDGEILDPKSEIAPVVRQILDKPEFAGLTVYLAGGPIYHHDFDKLASRETPKFMVLVLIIQMVLLLWLGRGLRGVLVSIAIVFLSIVWTMGAIGWLGFTLNTMVIILPSLLICVGIGDAIHFISEYQDHLDRGMGRRDAMLKAFSMVGLPCLLTTMTTMSAFLSFLTISIKPFREFGSYAAIGVVAALILTYILVPFFYSFGMKKNSRKLSNDKPEKRHDFFDRLLESIHMVVTTWPKLVVGFFYYFKLCIPPGGTEYQVGIKLCSIDFNKSTHPPGL